MIDLHSHILHEIDDGSQSLEKALELCKEAVEIGYKHICCTSHYQNRKYENKNYMNKFLELKDELIKRQIPLKIYTGNEIYLDIDTLNLLSKNIFYTLGYSKYILVEFSKGLVLNAKINLIKNLRKRGYKVLIAHIERYPELSVQDIRELKKIAKIQCNITAIDILLEKYIDLLLDGTIDIVASDAHNLEYRNYKLRDQILKLKKAVNEDIFKNLTYYNAKKILMDEE